MSAIPLVLRTDLAAWRRSDCQLIFPDSTYVPTRIRLGKNDTLLFFTDGVVEAVASLPH